MFKVYIENQQDSSLSWQGKFPTQVEAQSWLDTQILKEGRKPEQATSSITDISTEYLAEQVLSNRKKEYPSMEEVLHTILDHGTDSQEFIDLQAARTATKIKYPKQ